MKIAVQWMLQQRSNKAKMIIQNQVLRWRFEPVDALVSMFSVFTRSSAKGCSCIDLAKPMIIQKAVFKMKIASQWML
jgi:hypothetical protein